MLIPEVLGIDLAPGAVRRRLDVAAGRAGLEWRQLGAQPPIRDSPDSIQRLRPAAAQPHLQRILHRARDGSQLIECPALGAMIHRLARPPAPQQAEHLLEHLTAPCAVESECLALPRLAEAGDEAEQQTAAGDLIELGQLLGEQEWVAAKRDQVGAQVQPARAPGGEGQAEQWIEHRSDRKVRQPQPVEAGGLERLGEHGQLRSGQRSCVRADGEADLHLPTG
jgi:hypothetical protein